MRWIVLLLLLANIGLFAWFQTTGHPSAPEINNRQAAAEARLQDGRGERIQLLRELPEGQLAEMRKVPEVQPKKRPEARPTADERAGEGTDEEAKAESLCTLVGPFSEEDEYKGLDIVERLQALQVAASLNEVEMQGDMRYWVYLQPLGSRREAYSKLRELQSKGVDSYVIPSGSLTNGISFGIFSERERADRLLAELEARGIAVQSREEPQTYLERWVVLPPGAAETLAGDFWSQLQGEYPELDRRQNLCSELSGD